MARQSGRLAGKVALVTGAGSRAARENLVGTGRAIAILFARQGARVCLMDLDEGRARKTLREIERDGGDAFVTTGDVSLEDDVKRVVAETVERYGELTTLVNNVVSWGGGRSVTEIDIAAWDEHFAVSLRSVVLTGKYGIPAMIDSGGGSIISIASVAGMLAHGTPAYGAAKAAMMMLTRDIAFQYGRDGIRANVLSPGHIYTPLIASVGQDAVGPLRDWRRRVAPLGVEGTAWDVAWAAVYLASDESRFVSGLNIPIDGGVTSMAALMTRSDIISDAEAISGLNRRPQISRRGGAG